MLYCFGKLKAFANSNLIVMFDHLTSHALSQLNLTKFIRLSVSRNLTKVSGSCVVTSFSPLSWKDALRVSKIRRNYYIKYPR